MKSKNKKTRSTQSELWRAIDGIGHRVNNSVQLRHMCKCHTIRYLCSGNRQTTPYHLIYVRLKWILNGVSAHNDRYRPIINHRLCHKSKALSMNKDKICYKFSNYVSPPRTTNTASKRQCNDAGREDKEKQIYIGPLWREHKERHLDERTNEAIARCSRIGENEQKCRVETEADQERFSFFIILCVCVCVSNWNYAFSPTLAMHRDSPFSCVARKNGTRSVFGAQIAHLKLAKRDLHRCHCEK